jgi:hypothetical protein
MGEWYILMNRLLCQFPVDEDGNMIQFAGYFNGDVLHLDGQPFPLFVVVSMVYRSWSRSCVSNSAWMKGLTI